MTADQVKITGGCIDGVTIGANAPVTFTSFPNIVSVTDPTYGAVGDNTGDQSTAINAAINAIRSRGASVLLWDRVLYLPKGQYRITNPINLTCLNDAGAATDGCGSAPNRGQFTIISDGAIIRCATTNKPCIDGMGSRVISIRGDLEIYGACDATEPSVGLQHGRTVDQIPADVWHIDRLITYGCYKKAGYYNLASETSHLISPHLSNADTTVGGGAYSWIIDCDAHWQVTSDFVTLGISQDTPQSCASIKFLADAVSTTQAGATTGGGWIAQGIKDFLYDGYVSTNNGNGIEFYFDGVATTYYSANVSSVFNVHMENGATALANQFYITGAAGATPQFHHVAFRELDSHATTAFFARDAALGAVTMDNDSEISIAQFVNTPTLWDTAANYSFSGRVNLPSGFAGWSLPSTFSGQVVIGSVATNYGKLPTSCTGVASGTLYNNAGTPAVCP